MAKPDAKRSAGEANLGLGWARDAKAPKMSAASMRPHTASRRTHARPRLEAATLRVRAVTKVRAYVARLMQRVAAGEAPAATGTARGSSTATVRDRSEAMRACCRTRARRAASRESARRAVERCWADETDSEAEAVPLGCEMSDLDALRIARNRLAADVERLRALAREGDATAARRASSEALVWQSVTVPSDPWVRDPLHAYTPAARREIACAGALSTNDLESLDASEADDERDPYHPPFLTYIWEAASSRPLPTAFWRGTGAGHTEEVLGAHDAVLPKNAAAAPE